MGIFSKDQASTVSQLLQSGMSDFDIALKVCPAGEDPELLLDAIAIQRERQDLATTS
ncbi:hypothetical protein [Alloyangia pacifica]|uniref:hypothetical protein n=1 Tax=Alloyangia pacifica TaxID=311180 RepID=UPI001CFCD700|nr:hypothetical protein [Alloyangia pacifica]